MILLTILVYFLLVASAISVVFVPAARNRVTAVASRLGTIFTGAIVTATSHTVAGSQSFHAAVFMRGRKASDILRRHRFALLVGLAIIAFPPALVVGMHRRSVFELEADAPSDSRIAVLLEGEQLAPPAPLPPEVFTTREVEQIRPETVNASRDWSLLDSAFRQRLLTVYTLMRERYGYDMVLLEGYRSPERQTRLAAAGHDVTHASAYMSYHQFGLAADSAFYRDGKIVISEKDPWAMRGYRLYGQLAAQVGLTWGGNWQMQDLGHVELRRPGVLGHPIEAQNL